MKLTEEDKAFASQYDASKFDKPSVTADTVLFRIADKPDNKKKKYPVRDMEILLIKRKNPPYKGGWALPGGFCHMDETLSECAERELFEETGLRANYYGQIATYSAPDRDPRTRIISTSFLAIVPENSMSEPIASDDASEAAWFKASMEMKILANNHYQATLVLTCNDEKIEGILDLKRDERGRWYRSVVKDGEALAFDHLEVIACAIEALRSQIYRSPLAFDCVEEVFRIADLQSVYEAVVEHELLRTTFFEHVKPMLRRVDALDAEKGIMDQLYTYNEDYCIEDGMSALEMWLS